MKVPMLVVDVMLRADTCFPQKPRGTTLAEKSEKAESCSNYLLQKWSVHELSNNAGNNQ